MANKHYRNLNIKSIAHLPCFCYPPVWTQGKLSYVKFSLHTMENMNTSVVFLFI